jgi:hypothetical protein
VLSLAEELGIRPPEFYGWVSDERLQELLGEAHVICCLRHPILEGGSGSLIFSLYSGNPVIVADAGAYAQVPNDLIWKVSYGVEIDDVMRALESIAKGQQKADNRAKKARDWACRTYSVSAYVDKLLPFLDECLAIAPVVDAARVLGEILASVSTSLDEPALGRVAGTMHELFTALRIPENEHD